MARTQFDTPLSEFEISNLTDRCQNYEINIMPKATQSELNNLSVTIRVVKFC